MKNRGPFFHSRSLVESKKSVGEGTRVWAFAHIMHDAVVGRDCNIGDHAFIESGAVLGDRVTVKNGVCVWQEVTLGDDVFVGPNAVFTNDLFPASRVRVPLVPTLVKKGATIGANATIICGVTLGEYCMIGAGAVVTKDVPDYALYFGNPARLAGFLCCCRKKLQFKRKKISCGCGLQFEKTKHGVRLLNR